MSDAPRSARITVPASKARLGTVARAALEMTSSCFVWLRRGDEGVEVYLEEQVPRHEELEERFEAELDRIAKVEALGSRVDGLRAAIMARALGPRPEPRPAPAIPAPKLDPETEAEIERLLAEIESDDWLADSGEIGKTWEERFGSKEEADE